MNTRLILFLTSDRDFEKLLAKAVLETGAAVILVARTVGAALQTVCTRSRELDFAVIDFDDGCHGMTLLSALRYLPAETAGYRRDINRRVSRGGRGVREWRGGLPCQTD